MIKEFASNVGPHVEPVDDMAQVGKEHQERKRIASSSTNGHGAPITFLSNFRKNADSNVTGAP